MDAGQPPAIIEIQRTEKHDVRAEFVEYVARLLCRADGKECDVDIRCGTPSGGLVTCNSVFVEYPANRVWYAYREKAEALLRNLFGEK